MGFSLFEISGRKGRPVCLYEFTWGNTIWRYTSADRDVEFPDGSGTIWTAIPISDDGFTIGAQQEPLTVTLPARLPLCQLFRSTPPSASIWLNCKRYHKDDPDQEVVVYWVGTVGNIKRKDSITAQAVGLPISSTIGRTGLRLCWERNCPYALYDQDCKVDKENFRIDAVITSITGNSITVDALGAWLGERYQGGFIEWSASEEGTLDRRAIETFDGGTTFTLFGTTDRLTVGLAVAMFLGCDLTAETCDLIFNNLVNSGGDEFLVGESPFDGRQLFY